VIFCPGFKTTKSAGSYSLLSIFLLPCQGTSSPFGPFSSISTNSPVLRRLTKIGSFELFVSESNRMTSSPLLNSAFFGRARTVTGLLFSPDLRSPGSKRKHCKYGRDKNDLTISVHDPLLLSRSRDDDSRRRLNPETTGNFRLSRKSVVRVLGQRWLL